MYVRMYVCIYICMYVCMFVCMYVYFNEWSTDRVLVRIGLNTLIGWRNVCMYVCMYVLCVYVCMYVCMYIKNVVCTHPSEYNDVEAESHERCTRDDGTEENHQHLPYIHTQIAYTILVSNALIKAIPVGRERPLISLHNK